MDDAPTDPLWQHARPFASPDTDADDPTVQQCPVPCDDADIVGLGEATHGTREFARLKAGMVRHLVQRGFRTVAFEADVAAMLPVDRYVHAGVGDPIEALSGLETWMWRTGEVRDILRWLRSFNEGRPPEDRVRVRGVDLSRPSAPAPAVRSYLSTVGPGAAGAAVATLAEGLRPDDPRDARLDEVATAARTVGDHLERNREAYVARKSAPAWERARHLCRVVERACEWHRVRHAQDGPHPEGMSERDRLMAENAAWCLERDTGSGIVVWAHNSHVKRGTFDDGQVWSGEATMGERLHRAGGRYTPVGFDFGRGSFRAERACGSGGPEVFSVGDPRTDSATARFDALPGPFLLDVESAASDDRLGAWLDAPRRLRRVGSVYDPDAPGEQYLRTRLAESFDALVFVPESTPTQPLD